MLFACGGRGEGLFRENGVDSAAIMQATDEAPCVGFFANGELGPVGARISDGEDRIPTYLHGFTATCGVLVDTGSGEAGGADDASGDESGAAK